ncbi:MAG: spore germination protein [Bacillota bacterium]
MAGKKKGILKSFISLITYKDFEEKEPFVLEEIEKGDPFQKKSPSQPSQKRKRNEQPPQKPPESRQKEKQTRKPLSVEQYKNKREEKKHKKTALECGEMQPGLKVANYLENNEAILKDLYCLPDNKDIVLRPFRLGTEQPVKALAVYMQGLADKQSIVEHVIKPLMLFAGFARQEPADGDLIEYIMEYILPGQEITKTNDFVKVVDDINYGNTVLFIDNQAEAISIDTRGWEHRGIERPATEQVVRGPQEGFAEVLRSNLALIRKIMKNNGLITELFQIGERNRVYCAVLYLNDLANPDLVAEVKRRVASIKLDFLNGSCMLEQMIQDHPLIPIPTILSTERPDRVASYLAEGKVAILVDGSPFTLVVPATFFSMVHAAEDSYYPWPFGTFLRLVRVVSIFVTLLLPAIYLAVIYYHQEMLPTDLLLAIAGARERVPFPSLVEVLLMETSFELVREAGVRVPGVIGTTIGIVGALLLGQAAVAANLVSPILIIIVAVTGLASFAIPNYTLSFSFRLLRFAYIFIAVMAGLYGVGLALFINLVSASALKSFGMPYLSPVGPKTFHGKDVIHRMPLWEIEKRPDYLNPQDATRQPKVSRGWVNGKKESDDA